MMMAIHFALLVLSSMFLVAAFGARVGYHGRWSPQLSLLAASLAFVVSLIGVIV